MDSFESAFKHIIRAEGNYSNHAKDLGGPTRYGITQATLSNFLGRQATIKDVQTMSLDTARSIYIQNYWSVLGLSRLTHRLSIAVFDQAVNRGPETAAMILQNAVGVDADGDIGPQTLRAIRSYDEKTVLWMFCEEAIASYIRIVKNNPTQIVFLQGWINRVNVLISELVVAP